MAKKKLADYEKAECENLRKVFDSKKKELGLTQQKTAELLGITQGGVNHYLNGINPLNLNIASEFAKILQVPLSQISERLEKEAKEISQTINLEGTNINGGAITAIGGDQNIDGNQTNYSLTQNFEGQYQAKTLKEKEAAYLKSMPLLDINIAARYLVDPDKDREQIYDLAERAATFIPHSSETIGIKINDDNLIELSRERIRSGDILIVEPQIPPRDGDLVFLCINNTGYWRGLVCRLTIDINGKNKIKYDDNPPTEMPESSLIGGVVIELKRRLIPTDTIKSRIDTSYSIHQSATPSTK